MKSLGLMKSLALLGLALLTLTPRSVQAQAPGPGSWTVTDAHGNPAPLVYNSNDSWLLSGLDTNTTTLTGVYQQMFNDGVGQYTFGFWVNPPSSTLASNLTANAYAYDGGGDPSSPDWGWYYYNGDFISGGVNVTADSTPSATLTYTPPPGNSSPLPDHVDLLLTTTLTVNAFQDYDNMYGLFEDELYDQLAPVGGFPLDFVFPPHILPMPSLESSVTGMDSLGDNFSFSASSEAGTGVTNPGSFDFVGNDPIVSRHLVRVPVVNGVGRASVTEHISETANNDSSALHDPWNTTYRQSTAQAQANISTALNFDNREVTISSGIEDSFYKYTQPTPGSDRWLDQRNPDGSMKVDSAVQWNSGSGDGLDVVYLRGWQANNVQFVASTVNFLSSSSSPAVTWSLSSSQPQCTLPYTAGNFSLGTTYESVYQPDASNFPFTSTLTAIVTDSDGAVATNTYTVKWHLPYEESAFLGSIANKVQMHKLYGPVHAGDFADVQLSQARDIDISKGFDAAGAVVGALGQEEAAGVFEIIGKLADVADWKYHYGGEDVHYGTQNGQDKWTATLNNPNWAANVDTPWLSQYVDPHTGAYDGWVFCDLSIWEVKFYHHNTWSADHYTRNGFESENHTLYADPIDKIEEEPYYTKVSGPASPSSP